MKLSLWIHDLLQNRTGLLVISRGRNRRRWRIEQLVTVLIGYDVIVHILSLCRRADIAESCEIFDSILNLHQSPLKFISLL